VWILIIALLLRCGGYRLQKRTSFRFADNTAASVSAAAAGD
jgi:hypothetical protein